MQRYKFGDIGTANFPSNTADPAGVNGDLYYNTAINRFRGYGNGAWRNLAMEDTASLIGRTITVDPDHPFSTDTRTGISQYSQSVPFKTISAACTGAISRYDTVFIRRNNAGSYTENVNIAPNTYSGWDIATFKFEHGVVVNGNFTVAGMNFYQVNLISEGQAVINGSISGSNQILIGYIKGMTIRDGIYASSSIQFSVIMDSTITWINPMGNSLSARCFYSRLTWNAQWPIYGLLETTKFTYCEMLFNAGITAGGGGIVGANNVDLQFTNTKIDIVGSMFDDLRFSGFRLLFRSCYVRFTDHLFSVGAGSAIYAAHETKFVNRQPANNMITGGPGGWITEHINTSRNCPVGISPMTVSANDNQVVSITEFSFDGFSI